MLTSLVYESEHEIFRDSVKKFMATEVAPYHEQWEEGGQVDRGLWRKAGEQGFLAPTVPEEYGGVGVDFRYNAILDEECARSGFTGLGWNLHSDVAVPYIVRLGTDAQKKKYLPACVSGDIVTAIAMTEPSSGSDLQGIKTTAVRNGDCFYINGSKTFITNGQHADVVIVVAKTDSGAGAGGISLFLVEASTAGFTKGRNLKKIGLKAQDTSELYFQDVCVPAASLLGEEGKGFTYLMEELPQERLCASILAVHSAQNILEKTVDYVSERTAFGKPISSFQNTQFKLAEMDAELTSVGAFLDRCLALHLNRKLDRVTAAKLKLLTTDLQGKIMDECLQLHGGYGYMWEYPVARAWADARIQRIYGGTNEIMKVIISRALLKL
ncbi:acyl-CoA dehydrogenase family protein [Zhongshania aquimaris]|uniref:Acyl-CoA dehydrogenase family protein n=1 Tax=Zhongshania aquimaris TaxID=2857107 RepID=A0ABS6VSP5_9GAMM|nr:acyl-CoA dehydrogenase family protein [Zhongshania aquimaris]MBW2941329.1 acyl-CoA dehydrogenase family protein [Zhongshania aquimaris]